MHSFPRREVFDVAIIGGGLGGLALSIQLSVQGHRVILFEKEQYPFHKVCGEYISMESWDFLKSIGLDPAGIGASRITQLQLSAQNGSMMQRKLPLGGFGISRYLLDNTLSRIALASGVVIKDQTKVNDAVFENNHFLIEANHHFYLAKVCCGTYGKRSNIDIKWKRPFTHSTPNKLNNYIGVKYHVQSSLAQDTIALHNFPGGYCGLVKIEEDKYNLCYLTTADNLRRAGGTIASMERKFLWQNPRLKKIWLDSKFLFEEPLTISQVSFEEKSQVTNHVLMIGDAAGMITPLCGNGMSMALHASKIAAGVVHLFLEGKIDRQQMEEKFTQKWQEEFSKRLSMGRKLQAWFSKPLFNQALILAGKWLPFVADKMIRQTHGKPF